MLNNFVICSFIGLKFNFDYFAGIVNFLPPSCLILFLFLK